MDMLDFSSLPASVATQENVTVSPSLAGARSFEIQDEVLVYKDLSSRLIDIETKTAIERDKVTKIDSEAKQMMLALDEKQELLMRCQWLFSLYTVKEQIASVTTMAGLKSLRSKISNVQTCPLKKDLMEQLSALEQTLEQEVAELSAEDALIEAVFKAGNEAFINLGKAGRDSVITDVLKQLGKEATLEAVQEHTKALEQRVEALTDIKESKELIKQLDRLPIPSFHALPAERKGRIAETLLENNKWIGIASLDRMIAHLDKAITNEEKQLKEAENTILTSNGKAALTLDIKNVVDGRIQLI